VVVSGDGLRLSAGTTVSDTSRLSRPHPAARRKKDRILRRGEVQDRRQITNAVTESRAVEQTSMYVRTSHQTFTMLIEPQVFNPAFYSRW
jgi:hypothetical protein